MSRRKVVMMVFVGARPNIPKLWTLLRALEKLRDDISFSIVHSGQHYEQYMGGDFADQLGIPIDINLQVGGGPSDADRISLLISKIGSILNELKQAYVLVVGDVNTAIAAALIASRLSLTVIHLEAGMRSQVNSPEEINRKVITACSTYHLATTSRAVNNLLSEGIEEEKIFLVGNPMAETFIAHGKRRQESTILEDLGLAPERYILFTVHKAMNIAHTEWLLNLMYQLSEIKKLVFPCHPHTQKIIQPFMNNIINNKNVLMIKPLSYVDFGVILQNSWCVVTDSAGTQEESTVANVPCITVGLETARPETITLGTNQMVGFNVDECVTLATSPIKKMPVRLVYWDDNVSERIAFALSKIISEDIKQIDSA